MARGNKIERLPDHLRENLREMLATKQHTCQQIADAINEELAELSGVQTDVESIDDNTVWREKKRIESIADEIRRSQAYVESLSKQCDLTSIGDTGRVLMSLLQSAAFKTTSSLMGGEDPIDAETLNDLVMAVARLQRSANHNADLEKQIAEKARKQALAEAQAQAESAGKAAGLSSGNIDLIRRAIAGERL
ncbi:phage protein Gp27 family protein [Pseudoalteromonas prydzensis]|uniref:phage protein Gp27 family protein n=1 Tax=Pseudoalteromonas prydzensis TaxID=182141 RepID=UPI0024BCE823|nr:phage protein Gp27 family protein [Pseudoalteromonas prydzensis]